MKTLLILFFASAALTVSAQTNSAHNWTLKSGAVLPGDFFTSGSQVVVIKSHGTNYLLKISELSTNDWLYFQDCKTAQRQRQLDAEAAQMRANGWMEFTSDLILNFPEKVRDQIPGDGTIIHKYGWMDATFNSFHGGGEGGFGFGVADSQGKDFYYCLVSKRLYKQETVSGLDIAAGYHDEGTPNPLADVAFNLKRGDKIRLSGYCDDSGPFINGENTRASHALFFIRGIEIIQTAADADAVKKVKDDLANP